MKRCILVWSVLTLLLLLGSGPVLAQSTMEQGHMDRLSNQVTFGGYFETEFEDKEREAGDFDQHRTILFFGAQPHERIRMFSEMEIEHGGNPGEEGEIKLEQAWLDFNLVGSHNIRGGIDLIPVGRLNLFHDGNLRDFVFRPEVDERIIPSTWFEAMFGFNGEITSNLSYNVGISNGLTESGAGALASQDEIDSMKGEGSVLAETDFNNSKALWGRLGWSPFLGTSLGLSGYSTDYGTTGSRDITFLALDWNIIRGPWEFTGEAVDVDKDRQVIVEGAGEDLDGNGVNGETLRGISGASGGYLEVAYHFFPTGWYDAWFARGFNNPIFTALARYETLDFDTPGDPDSADKDLLSLGMNYRPIEQMAFKVSYDIEDREAAGVRDQDRFGFGMVLGF